MDEREEGEQVEEGPKLRLELDLQSATINPEKIAEYIARAFYKELRRHQFSNNQIIRVAGELIGCLTYSLEGYKRKVEREKEKQEG